MFMVKAPNQKTVTTGGNTACWTAVPSLASQRTGWPFFLLAVMALGFLLFAAGCSFRQAASGDDPVEPRVAERNEGFETGYSLLGRFSVVNPEMAIYSLEISESGRQILFSSEALSVSLLDEEGGLLWEIDFDEAPCCAQLSSDGRVAVVGTEEGKIYYVLSGGRVLWEQYLEGFFCRLSLSPCGEYLAASLVEEEGEEKRHTLYLVDRWGRKLWEKETGPVKDFFFSPNGELYIQEIIEENRLESLSAFSVDSGERSSWEKTVSLAAFSDDGRYAAFLEEGAAGETEEGEGEEAGENKEKDLSFYRLEEGREPQFLWSRSLEVEASWLELTEDGHQVIAYSEFSGGFDNLFAFGRQGNFLWSTRIPGGALLTTSPAGDKIVAASWQEYSEDFSKVMVLDTSGSVLQQFEIATRIEKIALSGWGNILALGGSDGNIFVLDVGHLDPEQAAIIAEEEEKELQYNPVAFGEDDDCLHLTLYFYDEQARELVPVNRSIGRTSAVLQAAIDELVRGPSRITGLYRTIPKDSCVDVNLEDNLAYLDLPEGLNQLSGPSQLQGIVDSLVLTASQFSSVSGVRFKVEGEEASSLGEELMLEETYSPERPQNERPVLFAPHRSHATLFLLPVPVEDEENPLQTPAQFAELLLERAEGYFPKLPGLEEARVRRDEIVLEWDAHIKELYPEEGSPSDKAKAHLFSDMFLLTLSANFPPDRVIFLVEGEEWEPPKPYPSFDRTLQRPFYINPE